MNLTMGKALFKELYLTNNLLKNCKYHLILILIKIPGKLYNNIINKCMYFLLV